MWFKNLTLFRLPAPWNITRGELEEQLSRATFTPCAPHEPRSRGWHPVRPGGNLLYAIGGHWLACLRAEVRLLPNDVVNKEISRRADAWAEEFGYCPGKKALRELKDRVIEELLPKAFTKVTNTFVWIDPKNGWFGVDTSSQAKADGVVEHLRYSLDTFPLTMPRTQKSPQASMADWLAGGEAPDGFTIDRDCELKAVGEEKSVVAFKRHVLSDETNEEIKGHLAAGKLPTRLALTWDERISFVLTEKLEIKRLTFLDMLKEQAEKDAEHADEQFDADFALMTGEFVRFIPDMIETLGGEVDDGSDLT